MRIVIGVVSHTMFSVGVCGQIYHRVWVFRAPYTLLWDFWRLLAAGFREIVTSMRAPNGGR